MINNFYWSCRMISYFWCIDHKFRAFILNSLHNFRVILRGALNPWTCDFTWSSQPSNAWFYMKRSTLTPGKMLSAKALRGNSVPQGWKCFIIQVLTVIAATTKNPREEKKFLAKLCRVEGKLIFSRPWLIFFLGILL